MSHSATGGPSRVILVLGAGKSASVLIDYLLEVTGERGWRVCVADRDQEVAARHVAGRANGTALAFDAADEGRRNRLIADADLVVSMLPAALHPPIAAACVRSGKHFVSASYVSPEIRDLQQPAERAGVTVLNEMGVDPGIDHMSAMAQLESLRRDGATITAFETFTGGLIAPASEGDNPWRYKFTWNPRNVVLAGRGGVKFRHHGRPKYIPYHKLFARYEPLTIPGFGAFEGYPNRDSLKYREHYGLWDVDTIYRGTLRRPGFCAAWDALVQLGLTDDGYELEDVADMTYRDFVNAYLWYDDDMSVELKLRAYLKLDLNSAIFDRIAWLGLFEAEPIGLKRATPAQVLQKRLEQKWALSDDDRDMIAMIHKVTFSLEGRRIRRQTNLVTMGENRERTAMAKTVGLTTGIGAIAILDGTIRRRGVVIPTVADVYEPVLAALSDHGIRFDEQPREDLGPDTSRLRGEP
ncbi:MAG: saccharopine dehydrogenase C-terminal domain-containing protein [Myxococcota bacterium]